ncbi:MAG TPA: nucleoside recognition domain-containing protein [Tepidisphaeraceae bacterium]|jgi:spore maturation protein A|nr:nucleoside recognition domain-containing protein [Tepidisphaeraceae bacterium]
MLNYIWAALIISSFGFALVTDIQEQRHDRYRNNQSLAMELRFARAEDAKAEHADVDVIVRSDAYRLWSGETGALEMTAKASLTQTPNGPILTFAKDAPLPPLLATIRDLTAKGETKQLAARVTPFQFVDPTTAKTTATFQPLRWVKMAAITTAAFDFAKKAVELAIGLVGVLALWLGLMRIAEASGLIAVFVKVVQPILHPLFPEIPKGHPALGMIALNLSANMLGLGNAATPMGIKAMEELQKLNPTEDTATNPMVMLLALNTAGVQLVPPAALVAIMGIESAKLFLPILGVTGICAILAAVSTKVMGRLPAYRKSDPNLKAA